MAVPADALVLNWSDLDRTAAALARRIRRDGPPEVIVGILRGGLVPAVMLAHLLGVRDVRAVEITHTLTDESNSAKSVVPQLTNPASLGALEGLDVLLVDDVAGSGDTITAAADLVSAPARVRRAVLVVNVANWTKPVAPEHSLDYIGCSCTGWVRFPWEVR
ncbi:phosphoribosyltransferase [Nocardia takedensis]